MRIHGLPSYARLDTMGEAGIAADRMEARAVESSSKRMFEALVRPLLDSTPRAILELGCGTAAMSRRIAASLPEAQVFACDKSSGMVQAAAEHVARERRTNLSLGVWDVTTPDAFPFVRKSFDLIVSSVMVPYLDDAQTATLVVDLAGRLEPRGCLAFIEQDLLTETLTFPSSELLTRVFEKDKRQLKRTLGMGLRPLLRNAGLTVQPVRSFFWSDAAYGAYAHDVLAAVATAALTEGRITAQEEATWHEELQQLALAGDFLYGVLYNAIVAQKR